MIDVSDSGYSEREHKRLGEAFSAEKIGLSFKYNFIIVKNSNYRSRPDYSIKKICEIVKKAGFEPLMSKGTIWGNLHFTVVPYKKPDHFDNDENYRPPGADLMLGPEYPHIPGKFIEKMAELTGKRPGLSLMQDLNLINHV